MNAPAHLLERIGAAFPTLPLSSVRIDPDGLVNDVVIINEAWVCRFAKDERGVEALTRETRILDLVRRSVDVSVPAFEHREADFVAYRLIRGLPLNRHDLLGLSDKAQGRLADQLAAFLRQLHGVSQTELDHDAIPRSDAQRTPEDWQRFYADLEREIFPLLWNDQRAWVAHHFAPVRDGRLDLAHQPVLIHGDLAQYHILYDPATLDLAGILDFGTAGVGDPAVDFAIIISMYGESFLRRVARTYPSIGGALDRARFLAGTVELQWALGGMRTGDRSWFVAHIGRARDASPIGTSWAGSTSNP
jgi:aminoglycoside 2''-phosphotransferase